MLASGLALTAAAARAGEPAEPPPADPAPEEPAEPPDDDIAACARQPVTSTAILGCDRETCQSWAPLDALMRLVRLGEPFDAEDAAFLHRRIDDSHLVVRSRLTCADTGVGAELMLRVTPMTFVRRVDITGNDAFRKKELQKRIFLRPGVPLPIDTDDPLADEQVRRQVESLERLYRQAGLDDVAIRVVARRVDRTHVDLEFVIAEGRRTRIESLTASHLHTGTPDPEGLRCPTIDQRRLERLIGLGAGDVWTRVVERELRERLRQAFQAAGFVRPKITIEAAAGDPGVLTVAVATERCWLVRTWQRDLATARDDTLSFRWTDPVDEEDDVERPTRPEETPWRRVELPTYSESLPFAESGSFERDEALRGVDKLAAELRARGYPFAEVRLVHRSLIGRPERHNVLSEVVGIIDYFITLNLERRLRAVRLEGVETPDVSTLTALMQTAPYDFLGGSGAFDEERVLADLAAIEAWYRERGFFSFRYLPPVDRPGIVLRRFDSGTRQFALEKDREWPHLTLVIRIDEGPRARIEDLALAGTTLIAKPAVEALTGLSKGRPFGPVQLQDGLEKLARFYRQRGYHRLTINPICTTDGVPIDCTAKDIGDRTLVHLLLEVHEGEPVKVGAVVWRGNAETDPHVLLRDLPRPGEVLDFDRINAAVRKMRALGIFNSVRVDVEGLEETPPRDVLLVVAVEEAQYRFLDVALGVRSIQRANIGRVPAWAASGAGVLVDQSDRVTTGLGRAFTLNIPDILLTFDFEYLDLNSLGVGNRLRIPFVAGFSLSQFLRLATFNPSYTIPRVLDSDLTLTTRGIAELDRVTDPLDRLELGLEGDLFIPLSDEMNAGFTSRASVIQLQPPDDDCVYCLTGPPIGYDTSLPQAAAETAADQLACDGDSDADACRDLGFRPQFTVSLRWRWDTQDTPLHPTKGVSLAATTSFILDRDRLSSAPVFNQFLKWDASARGAISLGSMVLAAFIHYGGAATFDEEFLPPDERFTLGGSNGMRGFADNGICRYDEDGDLVLSCPDEFGGNVVVNGSLELRVPIISSAGIWLGAFLDFGGLARSHDELYLASFRLSSGLGVRWLLGGLFPIRLDIGFPLLERRCVALREDGTCVREEPSQVHFGLLYTF